MHFIQIVIKFLTAAELKINSKIFPSSLPLPFRSICVKSEVRALVLVHESEPKESAGRLSESIFLKLLPSDVVVRPVEAYVQKDVNARRKTTHITINSRIA